MFLRSLFSFPKCRRVSPLGVSYVCLHNVPLWHHNTQVTFSSVSKSNFIAVFQVFTLISWRSPILVPILIPHVLDFCQGRHHFQVPSPVLVICCVINHYNTQWFKTALVLSLLTPWTSLSNALIDVRSRGVVLRLELGPDAWHLASPPGLSLQKTSYPSGLLWASLHQGSLVFFFLLFFYLAVPHSLQKF